MGEPQCYRLSTLINDFWGLAFAMPNEWSETLNTGLPHQLALHHRTTLLENNLVCTCMSWKHNV